MKKYLNKITKGDSLKLISKLDDNSIDVLCCDPPYSVTDFEWDQVDIDKFTTEWWNLVKPKLKENSSVYIFWSQKYIQKGLDIFDIDLESGKDRLLLWHHPNLAKLTKKMYLWTYDPIFYKEIGKPHFLSDFSKRENVDVFKFAKPQSNYKRDKAIHPTQKPIDLIKTLVKNSTQPDMLVLDIFSGSGVTACACKELGIDYIAFEKDAKYYKDSVARLKLH